MKSLKALALASLMYSFPLFADTYQCSIGVGWCADEACQKWESRELGSGAVDTNNGRFFPIEKTNLQFACGGSGASSSPNKIDFTNSNSGANVEFLCMISPVAKIDAYLGLAVTKIGAPLTFGVQVADESLPKKAKTLFVTCMHQK